MALGNFDGVHLGHRQVVAALVEEARRRHATPAVLVLDPHPRSVLHPDDPQLLLTDLTERGRRLRDLGVEELLVLPFGVDEALMPAEAFARNVLGGTLHANAAVVGENYRFGHRAEGTVEDLRRFGEAFGFATVVVPPLAQDGDIVSASRIRALLGRGRVEEAATLLGRPYALSGKVLRGAARGRTLGFPTLNVAPPSGRVWPAFGVYAVRVAVDGAGAREGVANFGPRPTFDQDVLIEAHLFDFDRDVYGSQVEVAFCSFVREQRRFDSPQALARQIAADVEQARLRLARQAAG